MNEAAVLALIGELYEQLRSQAAEIERLRGIKKSPEPEFPRKPDVSEFVYDPLAGPEEAVAQTRKENED